MDEKDENGASLREISELLLDFAGTLMCCGAQTSRVLRNVNRLAETFGCEAHLLALPRTMTLTLSRADAPEDSMTVVRKVRPGALDFRTLSELRVLTWEAAKNGFSPALCRERYEEILRGAKPFRGWRLWSVVACGNAAFCYLLGGHALPAGGVRSSLVVFVATFLGFCVRERLSALGLNHLIVFLLSAFVASFTAGTLAHEMSFHTDLAVSTSVLFLVPGVPLLNSVIDLIDGHALAGLSRLVNATLLLLSMTLGLILTVVLLGSKTLL
ncbi:MAG: threonine/serine exporter ThrE family protein [Candidatus Spyradosoma sp.]